MRCLPFKGRRMPVTGWYEGINDGKGRSLALSEAERSVPAIDQPSNGDSVPSLRTDPAALERRSCQ